MKRLTTAILFTLAIFTSLAAPTDVSAADSVNIRVTLILGNNEGGGIDSQLQRYERHLKRVVSRFDTFRQQGSGSTSISTPGSGTINIGGGHQVTISVTDAGDTGSGKLRIATRWSQGGHILIDTTIVSSRKQPTVLGGPSSGNGKLILLLEAR